MRRVAGAFCLCLLLISAGCATIGPGSVDRDALDSAVTYDWNTTADATVILEKDRYVAVYRLTDQESVELFRPQRLNDRTPVDPIGPDFRYPNGTVVNLTASAVSRDNDATVVSLPAPNGTLAFAAKRDGKEIRLPRLVNGSYEIILPHEGRVKYPLLGRVIPGGYDSSRGPDDRVHLWWDRPDRDRILVDYYLVWDFRLLAGLLGISAVAILLMTGHYLLTIRKLRRKREAVDVEHEESN